MQPLPEKLASAMYELAEAHGVVPPMPNPFVAPPFDPTNLGVQTILSMMEAIVRRILLVEGGSHEYPIHCMTRALLLAHMGVPPENEAAAHCCLSLLTPPPKGSPCDPNNHPHELLNQVVHAVHAHLLKEQQRDPLDLSYF
jgi:hypothetical protein